MLIAVASAVLTLRSATADVVYVRGTSAKPGVQKVSGTIVDYTGRHLTLQNQAQQQRTVPTPRVLKVEYQRSQPHANADATFASVDFAGALAQYESALSGDRENRAWVRREIVAQLVRCTAELERWERAGELFLLLVGEDPDTFHFDAIPLAWRTAQPSAALEKKSHTWIADARQPVANLIGASHLLPSGQRNAAIAVLNKLKASDDARLASLATAQLWRTQAATAMTGDFDNWRRTVAEMPGELRAGPLYVLGAALAKEHPAEGTVELLRAAILFPSQRMIARACGEQAAKALERVDAASAERLNQQLRSMRGSRLANALPADGETTEDERFLDGLRAWRLYDLARAYCQEQLAKADMPAARKAMLTVELMQTFSQQAAELPPDARALFWQAADDAAQAFAQAYPAHEQLLLVRAQQSLTLSTQAALLREEAEISGQDARLLEQAQQLVRKAVGNLKQLESDVSDQLRRRHQGLVGETGLSPVELTNLQAKVQFALGKALLEQGQIYPPATDDRINSLTQSIETFGQIAQLTSDEPLVWSSRVEEAVANRLLGRTSRAADLLARLHTPGAPESLTPRVFAEEIRCHLQEGNVGAALKIVQSVDSERVRGSGDFDLAQLEAYMAARSEANKAKDEARAARWDEVAARVVRQMEEQDGAYWARRGEALLGTIIASAPAGDSASLARSAASFQRAGKPDEALAAYERAIAAARSSQSAKELFELSIAAGLIEHAEKRFLAAAKRLREAALASPSHAKAADAHLVAIQDTAAWARTQSSPPLDEYEAILKEHLQHWPSGATTGQVYLWLGQLLQQRGQWNAAAESLAQVPDSHPQSAAAIDALSLCYEHLLDAQQSSGKSIGQSAGELAGSFERRIKGDGEDWPNQWTPAMRGAALGAARMWLRSGKDGVDKAEATLRAALDKALDAPASWRSSAMALLATCYVEQQRMADAGKMLNQVAASSPEDLLRLLGSIAESTSKTGKSAEQRRRAALLQLQIIDLLKQQGTRLDAAGQLQVDRIEALALVQVGDSDKALEALRSVAPKLPSDGEVQEQLAAVLSEQKEPQQLRQALAKWRELEQKSKPGSPRWFRANLGSARTQLAVGNKSQARAIIKLTQATRPDLGGEAMRSEFEKLLKQCE